MNNWMNADFYACHFKQVIFPFWARKGIDLQYGGYFTCFSNDGAKMFSTDKFTWSQGRMVWVLSELLRIDLMPDRRAELEQAVRAGAAFLMRHCLCSDGSCAFLMAQNGTHQPSGQSMYADCFVVLGLANYASVLHDDAALQFAAVLMQNIADRIDRGTFRTDPYPIPAGLRTHGVPMILTNTARTLADASRSRGKTEQAARWYDYAYRCACDVCDHFIDSDGVLREFIDPNGFSDREMLRRYINPGHTIEDVWFMLDEFERVGDTARAERTVGALKNALRLGWDEAFGGLLLFADHTGGVPQGTDGAYAHEPMLHKVKSDYDSKLWWVHSEALYSTVRCARKTGDPQLAEWAQRIFDYTFATFPNRINPEGEWIQIRARDGCPADKIVALPVKDPFHISRNLIKLIELLSDYK